VDVLMGWAASFLSISSWSELRSSEQYSTTQLWYGKLSLKFRRDKFTT